MSGNSAESNRHFLGRLVVVAGSGLRPWSLSRYALLTSGCLCNQIGYDFRRADHPRQSRPRVGACPGKIQVLELLGPVVRPEPGGLGQQWLEGKSRPEIAAQRIL